MVDPGGLVTPALPEHAARLSFWVLWGLASLVVVVALSWVLGGQVLLGPVTLADRG
ncbi:MAG: hypothetical protein HY241_07585 [Actinobacteria bacterium]|nr:hypothetical protein [Actinomycetota bacterium]